jgi:hypothetical protein
LSKLSTVIGSAKTVPTLANGTREADRLAVIEARLRALELHLAAMHADIAALRKGAKATRAS